MTTVDRSSVAELWFGPQVLDEFGPDDDDPTPADLDALATALVAANDGARPTVRVLEAIELGTRNPTTGFLGPASRRRVRAWHRRLG